MEPLVRLLTNGAGLDANGDGRFWACCHENTKMLGRISSPKEILHYAQNDKGDDTRRVIAKALIVNELLKDLVRFLGSSSLLMHPLKN